MIENLYSVWLSFLAGIFAPLTAVCVLPLYPAFLSYLSSRLSGKEARKTILLLGFITASGVIASMFLVGLIFTKILETSLTKVIGIISPIAFSLLAIVSLGLIFDFDFSRIIPRMNSPRLKSPTASAFFFGFFFGVIVLPCNPAAIIILFALSTTTLSFFYNLLNFIFFGIGMSFPLILFSIASAKWNESIITFLVNQKRKINLIAGLLLLGISLYYLIKVFNIFGVFG